MLIRYNNLKIDLFAMDAKPGGLIGAMLSPYLFSTNMNDFCKKFNDQSKDYDNEILLSIVLWTDIIDKTYTFKLKILSLGRFFIYFLFMYRIIKVYNLYDLILYYLNIYKISIYKLTIMFLASLRAIKRRKFKIKLMPYIIKKYRVALIG